MVTMSALEKVSQVAKLSDCLATSQSSARDHKLHMDGEDGSFCVNRTLSRSVTQNKKTRSDIYLDSACCKVDKQLVGIIGAQDESSLFSSSLSDLVNHKLRLSENKFLSRHSSIITSQKDEKEPFRSQEEIEGQTINNLLPDEEELFSGMVDEMGHVAHGDTIDDLEDFDVFTCGGGIELESDDPSQAGQTNVGYPCCLRQNHNSVPVVDHSSRVLPIPRLPSGVILNGASPHLNSDHASTITPTPISSSVILNNTSSHESSSIYNGFHTPVRLPSIGSQFGLDEVSRPFPQVHLDNRGIPSFHPHSPQVQLGGVVNIMPQISVDGGTSITDDIRPTLPEKVHIDFRHMGLTGHAMEFSEGGFGYSPNGIHGHQSVASKSNSYQQHHLRSLIMPNSGAFLNNNRAHHLGGLPGSPGAPRLMVNMVSPLHQLQVGSAPVIKASLWDRQQIYAGDSHEASGYQMNAIRGVGIPGFSASHPQEIPSHVSFSRVNGGSAELSRNSGVHSPQQMSHMFHERNAMNSLPTSFGSPSERVRNRRNETHLSHADRKHYELNIDRILRGEDSRTTLMIKNIPNKYTSKMLLATIDEQHRGKYDFIYLPIDFKNKCNMGYAFINMVEPLQIVAFHQTFEGRKWEKFNSEKVASLAYARIQGKAALIAHFQNSSLMNEDKRCRPILFHTDGPNAGDQEPFPMGTNFRLKPGRLQVTGDEEDE